MISIQYVNMRNQIYVSFSSSSISVVLGYRIGENKKRGMQNEEESTGCTSEWEFSRYVLFEQCEALFCPVLQFRNAFA